MILWRVDPIMVCLCSLNFAFPFAFVCMNPLVVCWCVLFFIPFFAEIYLLINPSHLAWIRFVAFSLFLKMTPNEFGNRNIPSQCSLCFWFIFRHHAFEHQDCLCVFVAVEHRQIWMGPICMAYIAVRFVYFLFFSCVHGCRRIGKKVCLHHRQTPSFEPHSTYKILSIWQKRKPKMHSTGFLWRFFLLLLWVCVWAIIAKQAKLNKFFTRSISHSIFSN